MLSNAYFLAKIRFDTAENEPAKNLQNLQNFAQILRTLTQEDLLGDGEVRDAGGAVDRLHDRGAPDDLRAHVARPRRHRRVRGGPEEQRHAAGAVELRRRDLADLCKKCLFQNVANSC